MCVHTWFRKCRSWLMMIMVASYAFNVRSSQPIEWMSRLFVGSSSSSTSGRENSACASSTRSFSPGGTSRIGSVVLRLVDAGVDQDRARARLGRVAVVLGELALEFGGAHVVGVGGVRIRIDAVALVHRLPELDVTLHHHVEHALVLVGELVLVQLAEAQPGLQHDLARRSAPVRRPGSSSASTCRSRWRR